MMKQLTALVVLAAGLAPAHLFAQATPDSGVFVIRHGGDTVATERFSRSQTAIEGTLAIRSSATNSQRYSAVLGTRRVRSPDRSHGA